MSTLKRELTKRYTRRTRLDLELALVAYIGWYNARRKHRSLTVVQEGRVRRLAPLRPLIVIIEKSPGIHWFQVIEPMWNPGRFTRKKNECKMK